jgi:hypothetical protein
MMSSPPNFWALFAQALELSAAKRSIIAFVPWWLFVCCLSPVATIYFCGSLLRPHIQDTSAVTVFSAIAVVGGFFGSVSIATMGQVQRMASEYPFSSYLRELGLFDLFLFWPQFTLLTQICLILGSTFAAAIVRLYDLDDFNQYIIAMDVGLLVYVCTKTWNLVDLIRKLTWHYEEYQRLLAEHRASTNP